MIGARAAAGHGDAPGVGLFDPDPAGLIIRAGAPRALAQRGAVGDVRDRDMDHAEDGLPVFNQGDVDGKFAVAFYEFARAVQRVHQPVLAPAAAFVKADPGRFLGQDRDAGRDGGQPPADRAVGRHVRRGQR